jgi:hypothetical protein
MFRVIYLILSIVVVPGIAYLVCYHLIGLEQKRAIILAACIGFVMVLFELPAMLRRR